MAEEKKFEGLPQKEVDVILQFEEATGKKMPLVSSVFQESKTSLGTTQTKHQYGFVVKQGHIIELGLCPKNHGSVLYPDFQLTSIPESLLNLKELRVLDLSSNGVSGMPGMDTRPGLNLLPEWIGDLGKLEILHLAWNKLVSLPESFGKLCSLRRVYAYQNNIRKLPKSIGDLKKLELLLLSHNSLTSLPDSFGRLVELREVDIRNNKIEELPDSFGQLISLKVLNSSKNNFSILPASFGFLESLEELDVSNNQLSELPDSFGKLFNLKNLDLSQNNLIKLPLSFGKLTSLTALNIQNNQLNSIPISCVMFDSNMEIQAENNPWNVEFQSLVYGKLTPVQDLLRKQAGLSITVLSKSDKVKAFDLQEFEDFLEQKDGVFSVETLISDREELNLDKVNVCVAKSDVLVIILDLNSIKSKEFRQVLQKAKSLGKKIIPVKSIDVGWENLAILGLDNLNGLELNLNQTQTSYAKIYKFITPEESESTVTAEIDTVEFEMVALDLKEIMFDLLGSKRFTQFLKNNFEMIKKITENSADDLTKQSSRFSELFKAFVDKT